MAKVVIVGGGAAGLGAAWTALGQGHQVVLVDANADLGGRCRTHEWQGEWLIRGAAAFIGGENEIVELCEDLGIYEPGNIISSQEEMEFTVIHPKLGYAFLGGFDIPSILASSVIPLTEKAKLALALPRMVKAFVSADPSDPTSVLSLDDVNACEYFRRYSPAFVDYILEPVMNMYCGYGEDDYSMAWLGWLMASPRSWSAQQWTFADRGVGKLTQTLEARLSAHPDCDLRLATQVTAVKNDNGGVHVTFSGESGGEVIAADGVILAIPGSKVRSVMPDLPAPHAQFFDEVRYVPHHILHMIIDKPDQDCPFSLLLPTSEGYTACSNIWIKEAAGAPGKLLFYGEVKGEFCATNVAQDDAFFVEAVWKDTCRAVPQLANVTRHERHLQRNEIALCSRRKGYTGALKAFRQLPHVSRTRFAGDYLINSTVGQSIRSGIDAALSLNADLHG